MPVERTGAKWRVLEGKAVDAVAAMEAERDLAFAANRRALTMAENRIDLCDDCLHMDCATRRHCPALRTLSAIRAARTVMDRIQGRRSRD